MVLRGKDVDRKSFLILALSCPVAILQSRNVLKREIVTHYRHRLRSNGFIESASRPIGWKLTMPERNRCHTIEYIKGKYKDKKGSFVMSGFGESSTSKSINDPSKTHQWFTTN
ncbi:hypothetical protein L484_001045 [Morus notabilis]|uniref:Uncharacterized protein n=1 Tax=Morus notabilis TaxID=981085 RepID=W9SLV9_9ROSA|nr:hypothetical protein L484_001045 [Morus notabilis]